MACKSIDDINFIILFDEDNNKLGKIVGIITDNCIDTYYINNIPEMHIGARSGRWIRVFYPEFLKDAECFCHKCLFD